MKKVLVVGACGRVGLPLTMVLKDVGYDVMGYDKNLEAIDTIGRGYMPFYEHGGQEFMDQLNQKHGFINFIHSDSELTRHEINHIENTEVVVVTLGTPIDEHGNPRLDDLFRLFESDLFYRFSQEPLIVLRSTIAPGTTDTLKEKYPYRRIVFAPERISQGHALTELYTLPQLIGAYNSLDMLQAEDFFLPIVRNVREKIIKLTPKEAEFAKLTTNMYRYVNFAFANEIYMLASQQGVDAHKIIQAANQNYPRMNMPQPGPNVGGPCLYKDGRFLVTDEPFVDMIQVSFQINESMPNFIYKRIRERLGKKIKRVWILGEAFKAGNDDTRNSLTFKLIKILKRNAIPYWSTDPLVDKAKYENMSLPRLRTKPDADVYVIMTNHPEFKLAYELIKQNGNDDILIVDAWKMLDDSKHFHDGIFTLGEVRNKI